MIEAKDILFVYGDGEWSVVWSKDTGKVLKYGDHDNVYEWLIEELGIEEPDFRDEDWYDPVKRQPRPLSDCWERQKKRYQVYEEANELKRQAAILREQADELETAAALKVSEA